VLEAAGARAPLHVEEDPAGLLLPVALARQGLLLGGEAGGGRQDGEEEGEAA